MYQNGFSADLKPNSKASTVDIDGSFRLQPSKIKEIAVEGSNFCMMLLTYKPDPDNLFSFPKLTVKWLKTKVNMS